MAYHVSTGGRTRTLRRKDRNSGVTASSDDVQVAFGYPHSVGLECGRGGDDGAAALELEVVRRPPHPLQMSASTG